MLEILYCNPATEEFYIFSADFFYGKRPGSSLFAFDEV